MGVQAAWWGMIRYHSTSHRLSSPILFCSDCNVHFPLNSGSFGGDRGVFSVSNHISPSASTAFGCIMWIRKSIRSPGVAIVVLTSLHSSTFTLSLDSCFPIRIPNTTWVLGGQGPVSCGALSCHLTRPHYFEFLFLQFSILPRLILFTPSHILCHTFTTNPSGASGPSKWVIVYQALNHFSNTVDSSNNSDV